jgi:hypothetical protein
LRDKRSFLVLLVFGSFWFSTLAPSSSAEGESHDTAVTVVRKFCQHDFDGGRLSGDGFSQIRDIIAYEAEPGWDSAVVVSGFTIKQSKQKKGAYIVSVKYRVVGFLDGWAWTPVLKMKSNSIAKEAGKDFQIILDQGRLKIDGPVFRPHISIDTALRICLEALPSYEKGLNKDGQEQDLKKTITALKSLAKQKKER